MLGEKVSLLSQLLENAVRHFLGPVDDVVTIAIGSLPFRMREFLVLQFAVFVPVLLPPLDSGCVHALGVQGSFEFFNSDPPARGLCLTPFFGQQMLEVGKEFAPHHEHQSVVSACIDKCATCSTAITSHNGRKRSPRWTIHSPPLNYDHVVSCLLELADEIAHRRRPCTDRANGRGRIEGVLELSALSNEFIRVLFESYFHDSSTQLTIQPHRREADPRSGKMACQLVVGHLCRNRLERLNAVLQVHDLHDRHLVFRGEGLLRIG